MFMYLMTHLLNAILLKYVSYNYVVVHLTTNTIQYFSLSNSYYGSAIQ